MATSFGVFKNAQLIVNGVDLSDNCESITFNVTTAALDNAAFGDETELVRPGLLNWSIEVNAFQDFASGSFHAVLWPIFSGRQQCTVTLMANSLGAISATNPMWSGGAYITNYTPMGGAHGENLMTPVTFSPATDLTQLTS